MTNFSKKIKKKNANEIRSPTLGFASRCHTHWAKPLPTERLSKETPYKAQEEDEESEQEMDVDDLEEEAVMILIRMVKLL